MKKLLFTGAICGGLFFTGCVNQMMSSAIIPQTQNTQSSINKNKSNNFFSVNPNQLRLEYFTENPILNIEMDLIFAEELATTLKLNSLILDRMPISTQDKWPELLDDFSKNDKNFSKEAVDKYDQYLTSLLKKDYSFYRIYDPDTLKKSMKNIGGLALMVNPSAMKKIVILTIIGKYGKHLEHTKNVISYKPLGCGVAYYNPKFKDMFKPVKRSVCKKIDREVGKKCPFFTLPMEEILLKYSKNFYDLKVGAKCFRAVEGKTYHSIKDAFYSLLPNKYKKDIKNKDVELTILDNKILKLKEKIKLEENKEKKDEKQITLLNKKLKELETKKENIEKLRKKLFEKATKEIVVDKNKILLAKKIKTVFDYINSNLTGIGIGTVVLSINTLNDVKDIISLGANSMNTIQMTAAIYLIDNPGKTQQEALNFAKKRLTLLLKRVKDLPANAAAIIYGIASQKAIISDYIDYVDAYLKLYEKEQKK